MRLKTVWAELEGEAGQAPTWKHGQAAGVGTALAIWPKVLLQPVLQGMELAVAVVDEVLAAPFHLHLDDKNLGGTEVGGGGSGAWGLGSEARGRCQVCCYPGNSMLCVDGRVCPGHHGMAGSGPGLCPLGDSSSLALRCNH